MLRAHTLLQWGPPPPTRLPLTQDTRTPRWVHTALSKKLWQLSIPHWRFPDGRPSTQQTAARAHPAPRQTQLGAAIGRRPTSFSSNPSLRGRARSTGLPGRYPQWSHSHGTSSLLRRAPASPWSSRFCH